MPVLTEELAHLKKNSAGQEGHRWNVSCLSFNPDGSELASGSWDKEVRIWDLSNLETRRILKGAHKKPLTSLSWHKPTGKLLCVGSADCTASLWNTQSGSHLGTLQGHNGWVLGVSFTASNTTLATGSWDNTIKIWDSETQTLTSNLNGHEKVLAYTCYKMYQNHWQCYLKINYREYGVFILSQSKDQLSFALAVRTVQLNCGTQELTKLQEHLKEDTPNQCTVQDGQ